MLGEPWSRTWSAVITEIDCGTSFSGVSVLVAVALRRATYPGTGEVALSFSAAALTRTVGSVASAAEAAGAGACAACANAAAGSSVSVAATARAIGASVVGDSKVVPPGAGQSRRDDVNEET
jgi:hypothetical protein